MKKTGIRKVMSEVRITQIPENALIHDVVRLLEGREMFVDADPSNTERIYSGDIFEQIASEAEQMDGRNKPSKKTIAQLEELAILVGTEYVQITNS